MSEAVQHVGVTRRGKAIQAPLFSSEPAAIQGLNHEAWKPITFAPTCPRAWNSLSIRASAANIP